MKEYWFAVAYKGEIPAMVCALWGALIGSLVAGFAGAVVGGVAGALLWSAFKVKSAARSVC